MKIFTRPLKGFQKIGLSVEDAYTETRRTLRVERRMKNLDKHAQGLTWNELYNKVQTIYLEDKNDKGAEITQVPRVPKF